MFLGRSDWERPLRSGRRYAISFKTRPLCAKARARGEIHTGTSSPTTGAAPGPSFPCEPRSATRWETKDALPWERPLTADYGASYRQPQAMASAVDSVASLPSVAEPKLLGAIRRGASATAGARLMSLPL